MVEVHDVMRRRCRFFAQETGFSRYASTGSRLFVELWIESCGKFATILDNEHVAWRKVMESHSYCFLEG